MCTYNTDKDTDFSLLIKQVTGVHFEYLRQSCVTRLEINWIHPWNSYCRFTSKYFFAFQLQTKPNENFTSYWSPSKAKKKKKKLASHYNSSWRRCSEPAQTVKLPDLISVCEDTKTVSPCNQPAALHKLEKTTGASFPLWRCHLGLIDAGLVLCLQPWFHPKVWPDSCWSPLLIWPHPRPPPAFFTTAWLMYFCPWELLRADWRHTFGRNSIDGVYLCWCFHVVKQFSIAIRSPPEEKKKKKHTCTSMLLGPFP